MTQYGKRIAILLACVLAFAIISGCAPFEVKQTNVTPNPSPNPSQGNMQQNPGDDSSPDETGTPAEPDKEMVTPDAERTVEMELEGMKELITLKLADNKDAGYYIYVDEEMYTFERGDGKDRIVSKFPMQAGYPETFMEIERHSDMKPSDLAVMVEKQLKEAYPKWEQSEVDQPIHAILIGASSGNKSNDTIVRIYIVEDGKGGSFSLKQQYSVEAQVGHGARFGLIVKQFELYE